MAARKGPGTLSRAEAGPASDVVLGQRAEAVEGLARIGRHIGAGREQLDPVPALERQRQAVVGLLVERVRAVAGRAGDGHGPVRLAVMRRAEGVLNRLALGLRQAAEPA